MKDINESSYYGKRSLHKHYFLEDYDNNNVFDIEEYIKRKLEKDRYSKRQTNLFIDLKHANLSGAILHMVDLSDANLQFANLQNAFRFLPLITQSVYFANHECQ